MIAHPVVRLFGQVHHHQAVGTDGQMALTQGTGDLRPCLVGQAQPAVVHDHKVVAGSVHLPELQALQLLYSKCVFYPKTRRCVSHFLCKAYRAARGMSNSCQNPVFRKTVRKTGFAEGSPCRRAGGASSTGSVVSVCRIVSAFRKKPCGTGPAAPWPHGGRRGTAPASGG